MFKKRVVYQINCRKECL